MKLIVGLGNPGKEYEKTRHNAGYMFIDHYASKNNLEFKEKMNAFCTETIIDSEKVIIIKPTTFMNLSGNAVRKYIDFYKIDVDDILVIYDDMAFEVGTLKVRRDGSSGGHNGINNIIEHLNTKNIKRVRIGISNAKNNMVDYVLGKFGKEDIDLLNKLFEEKEGIIEDFVKLDFEKLMNKYN